jgi:membrane associated rhomboid family serine protease
MLIPYQVDVPFDRQPVANWGLIAVTVAVFGLEVANKFGEDVLGPYLCTGWDNPIGWVTSLFLHADIIHLAGNMLFLWVFGNAVCAKVGNALYLPVYLAAGLAGNFAQLTSDPTTPSLGASGAINGMVGAYLVFFPTNDISCMLWIWLRPTFFTLSSYWIIMYFLMWDILGAYIGSGPVAHWAHLGGFAGGFAMAVVLLKTKVVKMERDELSLLQAIGIDKRPEQKRLGHNPVDFYEAEMRRVERETAANRLEYAEAAPPPPVRMAAPVPIPAPRPMASAAVKSAASQDEQLVRFSCKCGKSIKAPARLAGKKGKCPRCGEAVVIP